MTKRKPKVYSEQKIIDAVKKLPNPLVDKRHDLLIYIDQGRARSNQTRVEHIAEFGHDLKERDINCIPEGIVEYFAYKKDPVYKDTFNYYIRRKGLDKGFVKVSIQIDAINSKKAWIKTVFITYRIKKKEK